MSLSDYHVRTFADDGLLIVHDGIKAADAALLLERVDKLHQDPDSTAFEGDGVTPRALHGLQSDNTIFQSLVRLPALAKSAQHLLASEVYVYQFKINLKAAFVGEGWPWHQDYSFWSREDGMPTPRALTAAVFLDEVDEFNGPLYFIPGSHRSGCLDEPIAEEQSTPQDWRRNFSSRLPYQTNKEHVRRLALQSGMVAAHGRPGTVVFFDSNIVHSSPSNVSPVPRRVIFVTYNSVTNIPCRLSRPEFLVSGNATSLITLEQDTLGDLSS